MYFHDPESRMTKELRPGILGRSFWGDNLMLLIVDLEANAILPNHNHPHEQGGIVLEGELEFTIAGERRMLHPGDIYMIPGGVEHMVQVGASPARVLDVFSPVREDLKY
jgi:quercetin dioxygenase-like cupin family protein